MSNRLRIVLAGSVVIVLLAVVGWWLTSPKNYEECMLAEMRGQNQAMRYIVEKVCARRYKQEQLIYSVKSDEWDWIGIDAGIAEFRIKKKDEEYVWTRLQVQFSDKECAEAKSVEKDFRSPIEGPVIANVARIDTRDQFWLSNQPRCVRVLQLWGLYK